MTTRKRRTINLSSVLSAKPTPDELRTELVRLVTADLLGPAGGPNEEIDERGRVRDRYLVGTLAPRRMRVEPEASDRLEVEDGTDAEDGPDDASPTATSSLFPSSFGLSFCVDGGTRELKVTVRWGSYRRQAPTGAGDSAEKRERVWKRIPVVGTLTVVLTEGELPRQAISGDQPDVFVQGLCRRRGGEFIVTLFLVNNQTEPEQSRDEAWVFQPELIVEAQDGAAVFRRRAPEIDAGAEQEERRLAMVYRQYIEFATGHGVGVHWTQADDDPTRAVRISTQVIPRFEVATQGQPSASEHPLLGEVSFEMKALSELSGDQLVKALQSLPAAYAGWIATQRSRLAEPGLAGLQDAAQDAITTWERARQRMEEGVKLLGSVPQAAEAFRFANRAMWLQRLRTLYTEGRRRGDKGSIEELEQREKPAWRPFQLGFLLLNLPGVTRLDHPDRREAPEATADLLWFPTGGGKTEAYLGLAAYVMAIRRLQGTIGGYPGEQGVAVLMRYTLRLLTLQQFQRASALICACEYIRREDASRWGQEPFRIGLWVGQRTTPNSTDDSAESIKRSHGQFQRGSSLFGTGSPMQLTTCPWCGAEIEAGKHIEVETEQGGRGRTFVFCGDPLGRCPFTKAKAPDEGLPVLTVDEEIYRRLPALLIATVDKLAQMPWNGRTQMLFGRVTSHCPRHGFRSAELACADSHPKKGRLPSVKAEPRHDLRPPDLIIQDELHLISGPLGTLTGLYETAVDRLCTWSVNGQTVRPKVIASTATVRKAREQVHSLFLRRVEVFPPQGLDASDSFFAVEADTAKVPGRLYLGLCAPGRRLKAALIRVYVSLLAASQTLLERYGEAADPYLTLVGYFNAIRELAGMRRLVEDDVRSRLREVDKRGLARRQIQVLEELTSRKSQGEIRGLLDQMERSFETPIQGQEAKGRRPIDVLLATNMISVGVDVKRLGLMVVAGQPKNTAEYIQATSRVGRSHPGVVCTVYNWARPRDLSHYESFEQYHQTFYQHVEALSLTPFAARALDRGLSGLLVALVRLQGQDFAANTGASLVTRLHGTTAAAVQAIVDRAALVTQSKAIGDDVKKMLESRLDYWLSEAARPAGGTTLAYQRKRDGTTRALLRHTGEGKWERFTCPGSLRDVEPSVKLVLDDSGLDPASARPWRS